MFAFLLKACAFINPVPRENRRIKGYEMPKPFTRHDEWKAVLFVIQMRLKLMSGGANCCPSSLHSN